MSQFDYSQQERNKLIRNEVYKRDGFDDLPQMYSREYEFGLKVDTRQFILTYKNVSFLYANLNQAEGGNPDYYSTYIRPDLPMLSVYANKVYRSGSQGEDFTYSDMIIKNGTFYITWPGELFTLFKALINEKNTILRQKELELQQYYETTP